MDCAAAFSPWRRISDAMRSPEAVVGYMDTSTEGIKAALKREIELGAPCVDKKALANFLCSYFRFFEHDAPIEKVMENSFFIQFSELLLADGPFLREDLNNPAKLEFFRICFQKLRLASLLHASDMQMWQNPTGGSRTWKFWTHEYNHKQLAYFDAALFQPSEMKDWFLRHAESKQNNTKVHWVHVQAPSLNCSLAFGLTLHLEIHHLTLLTQLDGASAYAELKGDNWSCMVFPCLFTDKVSTVAFTKYRKWLAAKNKKAAAAGERGKLFNAKEMEASPGFPINVLRMRMIVLFKPDGTTLFSATSTPEYLARWFVDDTVELSSHCCAKGVEDFESEKMNELEREVGINISYALSHLEEDVGDAGAQNFMKKPGGQQRSHAFDSSDLKHVFLDVLTQLGQEHSFLRKGSPNILAFRIMRDQVLNFSNVMNMYSAAIDQVHEHLSSDVFKARQRAINKISQAKDELAELIDFAVSTRDAFVGQFADPSDHCDDDAEKVVIADYVREARVHLRRAIFEGRSKIKLCEVIITKYEFDAQNKNQGMLNMLSIMLYITSPIGLMTGWYGMNWQGMPELEFENAYFYFIAAVIFVTFSNSLFVWALWKVA